MSSELESAFKPVPDDSVTWFVMKNQRLSHTRVVAMQRTGERCSSSILVRAIMVSAMAFLVTLDQASER